MFSTTFPTSLQDLDATRGTTGQPLSSPNHITHHTNEDDTIEALQAKVGVDNSAVTTSLDYKVKSTSSIDPGHKHTTSAISSDPAGILVPAGAILPYGATSAPTGYLLCDGAAVSRATYATLFGVISTSFGSGDGSTTFNTPNLKGRFPLGYTAAANTKIFTFASRSSNVITVTGADNHLHNELQTGQAIFYATTGSVITGLTDDTTYYVIRVTATTFSLATSVANANAGTVIALSSDGTGVQTFTITYTARPLAQTGGEETHALTDSQMPSHNHTFREVNGGSAENGIARDSTAGVTVTSPGDVIDPAGGDAVHNIMNPFLVVQYIIKT